MLMARSSPACLSDALLLRRTQDKAYCLSHHGEVLLQTLELRLDGRLYAGLCTEDCFFKPRNPPVKAFAAIKQIAQRLRKQLGVFVPPAETNLL